MYSFNNFRSKLQENFDRLCTEHDTLFQVDLDKEGLWQLYLNSFPEGTNLFFRKRREYDCSCCRQFIRNIGNVVIIEDNRIHTIWELSDLGDTFQPVADALDEFVKSHAISGIYLAPTSNMGILQNYEQDDNGAVITWDHFYLKVPKKAVHTNDKTIGSIYAHNFNKKTAFQNAVSKITEEAVDTVLELIKEETLYRGEEYLDSVTQFRAGLAGYLRCPEELHENYIWDFVTSNEHLVTNIGNTSIGVLLEDISLGTDIESAVRKYERIVAPENYKRPKPIFTKKMLDDAKQTITDLGYLESLNRRFATISDLNPNTVYFINHDVKKNIITSAADDIFGSLEADVRVDAKKFKNAPIIEFYEFVSKVLTNARSVEVLLENRHIPNMVSLIAPADKNAPSMFKWSNGFSWSYNNNLTDSGIRKNVEMYGGKVDGVLRFSIQWNDEDFCASDYDAHCILPDSRQIFYGSKYDCVTGGNLDVDIIHPQRDVPAVENITFPNTEHMLEGVYQFYVNCFSERLGRTGFKAEIEFDGQIYSFAYDKPLRQDDNIEVANVRYSETDGFSIEERLPSTVTPREVWGLRSCQFVPVQAILPSPNYWDTETASGRWHCFFMLKDCINPTCPSGIYNEFMKAELTPHRKVIEALNTKISVPESEDQLSGVGFSNGTHNDVIVKVNCAGETASRIFRVVF